MKTFATKLLMVMFVGITAFSLTGCMKNYDDEVEDIYEKLKDYSQQDLDLIQYMVDGIKAYDSFLGTDAKAAVKNEIGEDLSALHTDATSKLAAYGKDLAGNQKNIQVLADRVATGLAAAMRQAAMMDNISGLKSKLGDDLKHIWIVQESMNDPYVALAALENSIQTELETNYVTKNALKTTLENYFDKDDINKMFEDYYTAEQVDNELSEALKNYYTKSEADQEFFTEAEVSAFVANALKNYYDKDDIDDKLDEIIEKFDDYYTKTEIDGKIGVPATDTTPATGIYLAIDNAVATAIEELQEWCLGDFLETPEFESAVNALIEAALEDLENRVSNLENRIQSFEYIRDEANVFTVHKVFDDTYYIGFDETNMTLKFRATPLSNAVNIANFFNDTENDNKAKFNFTINQIVTRGLTNSVVTLPVETVATGDLGNGETGLIVTIGTPELPGDATFEGLFGNSEKGESYTYEMSFNYATKYGDDKASAFIPFDFDEVVDAQPELPEVVTSIIPADTDKRPVLLDVTGNEEDIENMLLDGISTAWKNMTPYTMMTRSWRLFDYEAEKVADALGVNREFTTLKVDTKEEPARDLLEYLADAEKLQAKYLSYKYEIRLMDKDWNPINNVLKVGNDADNKGVLTQIDNTKSLKGCYGLFIVHVMHNTTDDYQNGQNTRLGRYAMLISFENEEFELGKDIKLGFVAPNYGQLTTYDNIPDMNAADYVWTDYTNVSILVDQNGNLLNSPDQTFVGLFANVYQVDPESQIPVVSLQDYVKALGYRGTISYRTGMELYERGAGASTWGPDSNGTPLKFDATLQMTNNGTHKTLAENHRGFVRINVDYAPEGEVANTITPNEFVNIDFVEEFVDPTLPTLPTDISYWVGTTGSERNITASLGGNTTDFDKVSQIDITAAANWNGNSGSKNSTNGFLNNFMAYADNARTQTLEDYMGVPVTYRFEITAYNWATDFLGNPFIWTPAWFSDRYSIDKDNGTIKVTNGTAIARHTRVMVRIYIDIHGANGTTTQIVSANLRLRK